MTSARAARTVLALLGTCVWVSCAHQAGRSGGDSSGAGPVFYAAAMAASDAPERTTVGLFKLESGADARGPARVIQRQLAKYRVPSSITQLAWIDRERLGILLETGQLLMLKAGEISPLQTPPESAWAMDNPGDGYGHQPYPARAGLVLADDGRLLLADCPYYVEGDGDCCHRWVYIDFFDYNPRRATTGPTRRPFQPPRGVPAAELSLRVTAPVYDAADELVEGPAVECLRDGVVAARRSYDISEYGEHELTTVWLGPAADSYLVMMREADASGEACEGSGAAPHDFPGRIALVRGCEDADDIPVYAVKWGPQGYWAYHATGEGDSEDEDTERWRLARYGVALRQLELPGEPVFRP